MLRARGAKQIARALKSASEPIRLKTLEGRLKCWSRRSMLDAPCKKRHFKSLFWYLYADVEEHALLDREVRLEEAWEGRLQAAEGRGAAGHGLSPKEDAGGQESAR